MLCKMPVEIIMLRHLYYLPPKLLTFLHVLRFHINHCDSYLIITPFRCCQALMSMDCTMTVTLIQPLRVLMTQWEMYMLGQHLGGRSCQ